MKVRATRLPQHRVIMLIVLCIILVLVSSLRVFQYQIVDGDLYLVDAMKGTTTTISIPAARGDIVDADGVVLAGSKASFDITLNFLLMDHQGKLTLKNEEANALIYRLIRTMEELGQEWIDDLPISQEAPYTFAEESEAAIRRLKNRVDVNEYATAENCIDWLFRECGIKKYRDNEGNCTHCGNPYDDCTYTDYTEEYARKIAGVRYSMLAKDFSSYNSEYTFAKDVSIQTVALIRELSDDFIGATIKETSVRTYLSGEVAPQIIGTVTPMYDDEYETIYSKKFPDEPGKKYSRDDLVGRSGIEAAFEDDLRGTSGTMTIVQNNQGDIISVQETSAPIAGKTVQLTLDYSMTSKIQTELTSYIEWYNSINGAKADTINAAVVVLDAKNGGLLSSISFPYYDINDAIENYSEVANREGSPLVNRALNGLYRPGSTFKCVVAAAGFAEGFIDKDYTCYCNGDFYTYYAPWYPNCVGTGHFGGANLNVAKALHFSCNSFFYDLGRIMGIDIVGQYSRYFGLGVDTGLEVSSQIGRISKKTDANWEAGNVIQASIGQMNTNVTPLQMAVEAMTIANHGTRYETHLLNALLDENNAVVKEYKTTIASQFEMSDEAYQEISKGMNLVAGNLYAPFQVNDLGYEVYIKTGTPQATASRTHHCIIAYITKDGEPEIAVSIMQEDGAACQRFLRQIILAYDQEKYPEKYASVQEPIEESYPTEEELPNEEVLPEEESSAPEISE